MLKHSRIYIRFSFRNTLELIPQRTLKACKILLFLLAPMSPSTSCKSQWLLDEKGAVFNGGIMRGKEARVWGDE